METKMAADYPHHLRPLTEESGIRPEVILGRGYRTVKTKAELKRLGFSKIQQLAPALVIPMYDPDGKLATHQIKPDSPRVDRDGKPIKYETPAKSRLRLDAHPSQAGRVKDPKIPLWITEGVKMGDCLVSHGSCALALPGVWGWQKEGVPLPDWEGVKLHGRTVYVVFDSDVMTKTAVQAALKRLVEFLAGRGAQVKIVYLPDGEGGKKQGVDDYLVAGGTVEELEALAEEKLRERHVPSEGTGDGSANSANNASGSEVHAEAAPWEPPAPFHEFDLPAFPIEVLPGWARDFVEAEANATQTPVDLAAMLVLSVMGLACAKVVEVEPWKGWREPVNLYTVTAMPPGSRKSHVFADVMATVEKFEAGLVDQKAPEIAEQQTRYSIYEGRLQKAQKAAANAKDEDLDRLTAEAMAAAKDLDSIKVPAQPRLLADDASPERRATLLVDQGGRMAVMSPEGDVFDMMAGRYSRGVPNLGVYLKGHAGDDIRVDRMGRPAEYAKRPALTLGLTVQPSLLRGLAACPGFRGRGLLGRFLYSLPENLLGFRKPDPQPVPERVKASYERNVGELLALASEPVPGEGIAPKTMRMNRDARRKMGEFVAWIEPQLAEATGQFGDMTDWAGKLAGAVARIAGVLHCMESSTRDGDGGPWDHEIDGGTLDRACEIGRYLMPHARAADAEMGADPTVEEAKHVLRWIERKGIEAFTKREAFEGTKGRFGRVTALEPALNLLAAHGYIREEGRPAREGPGRKPSERYAVNPYSRRSQ